MQPPSSSWSLLVVLGAPLFLGCSTPRSSFGDVAVYSPSVRAYVVDPDLKRETSGEAVPPRVLTDPVTSEKIRCKEDVERWKLSIRRAKVAQVQQSNAETSSLFWPLTYALAFPSIALDLLYTATAIPYHLASPRTPRGVYHDGLRAFARADYRRAAVDLETALLQREVPLLPEDEYRGDLAQRTRVLFYLGLSYEQLGDSERAVAALSRFTRHALRRDGEAYDTAEERLTRLGAPLARCASTDAVPMAWDE